MAAMARIRATLTELKRVASVVVDPKAILMDWYKKYIVVDEACVLSSCTSSSVLPWDQLPQTPPSLI